MCLWIAEANNNDLMKDTERYLTKLKYMKLFWQVRNGHMWAISYGSSKYSQEEDAMLWSCHFPQC